MPTHILNRALPMWSRVMLADGLRACVPSMRHLHMPKRLEQMARVGFKPARIVDVGAAHGEWSCLAHKIWPKARIFAFEPDPVNHDMLEKMKILIPGFDYRACFLGKEHAKIKFSSHGTHTSLLTHESASTLEGTIESLDQLVTQQVLPAPDFLKLDVQGYEMQVLSGATQCLATCQAVLLEVNFMRCDAGMPVAGEVIAFLRERGYEWHDVMGILRRPSDDALFQMDLFFLKADHPLRHNTRWE